MYPVELRYTKEHEWVKVEDGNKVRVGITDFAQSELGDVVFVELPDLDLEVETGDNLAVVESVKAVSDIYAPISGIVAEVNDKLSDSPELVNQDPYGQGWIAILEIQDASQIGALLTAEQYEAYIEESK
ncbi:MAG TPA: glycine cleavage system protein GcvH [Firmicutes bacterium]|jgi:glycine cleavage system H protein|nr:glycine cleavage system protein GcvH [Bacillota bacterium]